MTTLEINSEDMLSQAVGLERDDSSFPKLIPAHPNAPYIVIDKPMVRVGRCDDPTTRSPDLDHAIFSYHLRQGMPHTTVSTVHFSLQREKKKGRDVTILKDLSTNGTFVNGERIKKGNTRILVNSDEISLSRALFKMFVYVEPHDGDTKFAEQLTSKYIVSKKLGSGACGEVMLGYPKKGTDVEPVAIKCIQKVRFGKKSADPNYLVSIAREIDIMKKLKHPNIVRIEDVIDTEEVTYIILELITGGEFFDMIVKHNGFNEDAAKIYAFQMVQAVKYLHENKVSHRDLKPENILVCSDDDSGTGSLLKVTDFGLSKFIDEASMMKTFVGTPNYLAPEIVEGNGHGHYTEAVDLWSLGVIIFVSIEPSSMGAYPPFSNDYTDMALKQQILKGRYHFDHQNWKAISDDAKDLIKKMLDVDPKTRITAAEALNHPWFQDEKMRKKVAELTGEGCPPSTEMNNHTFATPSVTDFSGLNKRVSPKKRGAKEIIEGVEEMEVTETRRTKRAK